MDSIRLGVFAHNPGHSEEGVDLHGQILFDVFARQETGNALLDVLFNPKLHLGGSLNLDGDTSFGYAGATWRVPVGSTLFLEGDFGFAVHNGEFSATIGDRAPLGCAWSFREAASIGVKVDRWEVLATVEHLSNAGLCDENAGLTNYGLRFGTSF